MSAAQKQAQANFKKAIAYRQKNGCTLKEAFAAVKGKKVVKKSTPKKRVGATMFIEKGESAKKRPTEVIRIVRNKNNSTNKPGTFKKFERVQTIGSILKQGQKLLLDKLGKLEAKKFMLTKAIDKRKVAKEIADVKKQLNKLK